MKYLINPKFGLALVLGFLLVWALRGSPLLSVSQEDRGEYVGSETCSACHEDHAASFNQANPHATVPEKWGVVGCEACHGPGSAHVDNEGDITKIRRFKGMKAADVADVCLKCHEKGEHTLFIGGAHDSRGVGCATCHSVHQEGAPKKLLAAKSEFDLCTSCHLRRKAALMRSSHMPMREGTMTCSSCHNVHGGIGPANLRQASVNDNCYTCHTEKRAPMLWEHPPVKENCANCHDPHGSLHPGMLVTRSPQLCQQCHDEARHMTQPWGSADIIPGTFTPSARGGINKACMNCHQKIHGSNHPSGVRFNR